IDMHPDRSRPDRDGGVGHYVAGASRSDESVVQDDGVHRSRPDEERVRRVRRALITVATSFYDQSQIVPACEVDGRDHVARPLGGNSVNARYGGPRFDPAGCPGEPDLIAE